MSTDRYNGAPTTHPVEDEGHYFPIGINCFLPPFVIKVLFSTKSIPVVLIKSVCEKIQKRETNGG
jgi:hypothetical protein